jgi:hypothetical protein
MIPNGKWDIREFASQLSRKETGRWIGQHTAMLVVHGIGNQVPLGTLDSLSRTLLETLQELTGEELCLQHQFEKLSDGDIWFNNYIRIKRKKDLGNPEAFHLDLYEYYWAACTQDTASLDQIRLWIRDTVKQARRFYNENGDLLRKTSSTSAFIGSSGKLNWFKYSSMLFLVGQVIPSIMWLASWLPRIARLIPVVGSFLSSALSSALKNSSYSFANVIGDIVVYNTTDPKSNHFKVRRQVLAGAVTCLRRLVEPEEDQPHGPYGRVLLAGHSLGSQIAFDALNRLNHLITQNDLRGINSDGTYTEPSNGFSRITDVLGGFITFGSPLDKIAFFIREQSEKYEYIKIQMLRNYHCFKQRSMPIIPTPKFMLDPAIPRLFDDIRWINYHDKHDPVSGKLDFYEKLVNVHCDFRGNKFSFSHGWYWNSKNMFTDIIENFLLPDGMLRHNYTAPFESHAVDRIEVPRPEKKKDDPDRQWFDTKVSLPRKRWLTWSRLKANRGAVQPMVGEQITKIR